MKREKRNKPWAAGLLLVALCLLLRGVLRLMGCRGSEEVPAGAEDTQ